MRVKSMAKRHVHVVYVPKADKLPYRRGSLNGSVFADSVNCVNCGWPIKVTSSAMRAGQNQDGSMKYAHALCPSLSERKRLRAEALEQG